MHARLNNAWPSDSWGWKFFPSLSHEPFNGSNEISKQSRQRLHGLSILVTIWTKVTLAGISVGFFCLMFVFPVALGPQPIALFGEEPILLAPCRCLFTCSGAQREGRLASWYLLASSRETPRSAANVMPPSMQGHYLFSLQVRKIIHRIQTAFKMGFVLFNETRVQRFPPALTAWKGRLTPWRDGKGPQLKHERCATETVTDGLDPIRAAVIPSFS